MATLAEKKKLKDKNLMVILKYHHFSMIRLIQKYSVHII